MVPFLNVRGRMLSLQMEKLAGIDHNIASREFKVKLR